MLFSPEPFYPYGQNDCTASEVAKAFFERENGCQCLVLWKPSNILSTDFCGTVSFQFVARNNDLHFVNLCTGDVYELTTEMAENLGNGCFKISHLPITDFPTALISGNFCDWSIL